MTSLLAIWSNIWPILVAILAFAVLVIIHEFGHFTAAKKMGVKVNEFSVGFGPKLFGITKGETTYSVRLFPLGGFCAMEGEEEDSTDSRAFNNKPVWRRALIAAAGPFNNILLAYILFIILVACQSQVSTTTVAGFFGNQTSHKSGLEVGDKITRVNGSKIYTDSDLLYELLRDKDGVFDMTVVRDGSKVNLSHVKFEMKDNKELKTKVFVRDFYVEALDVTPGVVLSNATAKTFSYGRIIWKSLIDLCRGRVKVSEMSGPVGTVQAIGDASKTGILDLTYIVAFISLNLGIFNLIPFPALDGGRLLLLAAEEISRRKIPTKYEAVINLTGLALLMLLVIWVSYFDISRIVS